MARAAMSSSLRITAEICNEVARYIIYSLPPALADEWKRPIPAKLLTRLPPSEPIADAVKRSLCLHVFYFCSLLSQIASVPRKAPSRGSRGDRLFASGGTSASKDKESTASARIHQSERLATTRSELNDVSFDARVAGENA